MEDTIISDQIAIAPEEVRNFLLRGEWLSQVKNVASSNNFSPEQSANLENEVIFVLLALDLKKNFKKNLEENLGVSSVVAQSITTEIETKIFSKIDYFLPTEVEGETISVETKDAPTSAQAQSPKIPPPPPVQTMSKNIRLDSGDAHLIEDAQGNADNNLPELPGEREVSRVSTPTVAQPASAFVPKQPTAMQKPEPALTDAEWEARKKALEAGELVMKTAYGQKPDPYREPTN